MKKSGLVHYSGMTLWYLQVVAGMAIHGCAVYGLLKKKSKRVGHMLLLHLCFTEFLHILWDLIFYSLHFHTQIVLDSRIHLLGNVLFGLSANQTIAWITVDRILAVKLTLRYRVMVTRKKFYCLVCLIWSISVVQSISCWFTPDEIIKIRWLIWDTIVSLIVIFGYIYITVAVFLRHKSMRKYSSQLLKSRLKHRVPFLVVSSFVLLNLIPDALTFFGSSSVWLLNVLYMNYLLDPLIYVFYSKSIRHDICRCKSKSHVKVVGLSVLPSTFSAVPSAGSRAKKRLCISESTETSIEIKVPPSPLDVTYCLKT